MPTSHIARTVSLVAIMLLLGWTGIRSLGARLPATPNAAMPKPALDAPLAMAPTKQTAVFSGGCFWGVQAVFEHVQGVRSATSGYAGGFVKNPSYEAVSTGMTGHAETVSVVYDPSKITYGQLLMVYFSVAHDPTQLNRQGPDSGSQYRSSIFYTSDEQKRIAEAYVSQLTAQKLYARPIVTKIVPFETFYPAEDYHQDFLKHNPDNPYIQINDLPKLEDLKRTFPSLYRN
jgi:peptide-methionine (S)-S-oxide reductase